MSAFDPSSFSSDAFSGDSFDLQETPGSISGTCAGSSTASGTLTSVIAGGAGRPKKRRVSKPNLAVVTIEGQDYRVPIDSLQAFLDARIKKIEVVKPVKVKKKKVKVESKPPRIVIKSAPAEFMPFVQKYVDKSNEILRVIWERTLDRMIRDMEDDEAISLLLLLE